MNPILLFVIKLLVSSALLTLFYIALFRGKASYGTCRLFLLAIPVLSLVFSIVSIEGNGRFFSFSSLLRSEWPATQPSGEGIATTNTIPPETLSFEEAAAMAVIAEMMAGDGTTVDSNPAARSVSEASGIERHSSEPVVSHRAERPGAVIFHTMLPPVAYFSAIAVFAAVILRQMLVLRRVRRMARRRLVGGSSVYFSREVRSAFSVMRSIYVNPDAPEEKLAIVIRHEKEHIAHRHYVDLAVMELFTLLLWFNPIVWFVRRELRSVHEFQADRGTLEGGVDMHDYMLAILEETAGAIPQLANGMKSSMIKKRFLKMKTENKIRLSALRTALTLPFAAALMLFLAFKSSPAEAGDAAVPESPTETAAGTIDPASRHSSPAVISDISDTGFDRDSRNTGIRDTSIVVAALRDGWITVRGDSTRMVLNGIGHFNDFGDIRIAFDSIRRVFSLPRFKAGMDSMRIVFSSPGFRGAMDSMRIVFSSPEFKADIDSMRRAFGSLPGFRISSAPIPGAFLSPEFKTQMDSLRSTHKFSFDKITYSHSPSVSLQSVPQFFGRSDTIIMDMNGRRVTVYTRRLKDVREMAERYEKGAISKDEYLAAITDAIKNDVQTEMRMDVSNKSKQLTTKDFPADFDFAYHRLIAMPDGRVVSINEGVEINGATWALSNVDWSGTFAARPEDLGGYYKHSEAKCPEGWRLPTIQEINSLAASGSRWTTVNGVAGREYGSGTNTIFLPAAGRATVKRDTPRHKLVIRYITTHGFYWTSTKSGVGGAHDLLFNEGFSGNPVESRLGDSIPAGSPTDEIAEGGGVIQRRNGLSVRCVKQ